MKPLKTILKKPFVWEERDNCDEETNLKPQYKIGNIDWCKCVCECKLIAAFAKNFCLLLRLKSQSARGASCHLAFATAPILATRVSFIYLVDELFFLFLL